MEPAERTRKSRGTIIGLLLAMVIGAGVVAGVILVSRSTTTTLNVQLYGFTLSPQGVINTSKVYYVLDGQHELVIQVSADTSTVIEKISSDARTYNVTGFTVTQTPTWVEIPGWNCGYTDSNGQQKTTQMTTSAGNVLNLSYPCIYPPTSTQVAFTGLVRPTYSIGNCIGVGCY